MKIRFKYKELQIYFAVKFQVIQKILNLFKTGKRRLFKELEFLLQFSSVVVNYHACTKFEYSYRDRKISIIFEIVKILS